MVGDDLKRLRDKREWSQQDLATTLNALLDKNYGGGYISQMETGNRKVPAAVAAVIEELLIDSNLAPSEPLTPSPEGALSDDSSPGQSTAQDIPPGAPPPAQPVLSPTGGTYAKACTQLWEIIAMGVGTIGAAVGNRALMYDGEIIEADKEALGEAWGKLAESNDVFRKWVGQALEGGAWVQVCLATGGTMARCHQNHRAYARHMAEQAVTNGSGGDGSSTDIPAAA